MSDTRSTGHDRSEPIGPGGWPASPDDEASAGSGPAHLASGSSLSERAARWGADEPPGAVKSWLGLTGIVAGLIALGVFVSWPVVVFILAIVFSVFLHEMGHFLTAKWAGMKVTEFFIGFGPRIWSFRRGETEYGLKVLPAGAYVRIIGMHNLEEVPEADEDRTYRAKPYRKRLPVILAGPAMNILLGFVILVAVFATFGRSDPRMWPVGFVAEGSSAEAAGIQPGDRILSVDGEPVGEFRNFRNVLDDKAGREVTVEVVRDGQTLSIPAHLGWKLNAEAAQVVPPLRAGDVILDVGGTRPSSYEEFARILRDSDGTIPVRIERGVRIFEVEGGLRVPVALPDRGAAGFFGVSDDEPLRVRQSLPAAIVEAGKGVARVGAGSVVGIGRLFSPSGVNNYAGQVGSAVTGDTVPRVSVPAGLVEIENPHSPLAQSDNADRPISIIGVVRLLDQMFARSGWAGALELLAIVNVFLGLINLIPLLPFDGGHAAVATYEAARSRRGRPYRVDMAKLMPVTYAVVLLLVLLGVTTVFLDIARPVSLP